MTSYAQDQQLGISMHLAACTVAIDGPNVETILPGGQRVLGMPMHDAAYRATAHRHGYGADVARLNVDHELTHTLIAHWLGIPCSPTFRRVANGDHDPTDLTRFEEGAVLSLQAYAVALGVDLVEIAKRWAE